MDPDNERDLFRYPWMERIKQNKTVKNISKLCKRVSFERFRLKRNYQQLSSASSHATLVENELNLLLCIIERAFEYLDVKSLCRCSQVCRQWRQLAISPNLWQMHLLSHNIHIQPKYDHLFVNGFPGLWFKRIYFHSKMTTRNWATFSYTLKQFEILKNESTIHW